MLERKINGGAGRRRSRKLLGIITATDFLDLTFRACAGCRSTAPRGLRPERSSGRGCGDLTARTLRTPALGEAVARHRARSSEALSV